MSTSQVTGSESGDAASSDATTSSGPPADCSSVDCGPGRCVAVESEPTCACDPGYYAVGLSCLDDPCGPSTRCVYFDGDADPPGVGSLEAPFATLDELAARVAQGGAGDHFLLKRGSQFATDSILIDGAKDAGEAPIVIGAYGDPSDPRPLITPGAILLRDSLRVTIRDLQIVDQKSLGRACIRIERSSYVVVQNNTLSGCGDAGIRVLKAIDHAVVVDNTVRDIGFETNNNRKGIAFEDTDEDFPMGDHLWVIDNNVEETGAYGIFVDNTSTEIGDAKILGNTVDNTGDWGVYARLRGFGWVVGNTVSRGGPSTGAILVDLGHVQVSGNETRDSPRGLRLDDHAVAFNNTIGGGSVGALVITTGPGAEARANLVVESDGGPSVFGGDALQIGTLENNWYVGGDDPNVCAFAFADTTYDFDLWQTTTGLDGTSTCGTVPGLDEDLRPGISWPGCDVIGAWTCSGSPLGRDLSPWLTPAGVGWRGPLLVQQRYPLE